MKKTFFTLLIFILSSTSFIGINYICKNLLNIDIFFFTDYIPIESYHLVAIVFFWGFSGGLLNSLLSKWQIKKLYNLQKIDDKSVYGQKIIDINNKISRILKVKAAKLYFYKSDEKNAFVTGFSKNSAMLVVSSNLLYSLDKKELEAVLWHEYAHIVNGDMTTQQILEGVINSYILFASKLIQLVLIGNKFKSGNFSGIFIVLAISNIFEWAFLFFAKLFYLWFSRRREIIADRFAVKYQGSGLGLLSALQNISHQPESVDSTLLLSKKMFNIYVYKNELLSTHPNFKNRIINIEKSI